jgi:hypothetical protein
VGKATRSRERAPDGVPTMHNATVRMEMVGTARKARLCPPYGFCIIFRSSVFSTLP